LGFIFHFSAGQLIDLLEANLAWKQ